MQFLERYRVEAIIFLCVVVLRLLLMSVLFYAEGNMGRPFPLAEIDAREYYKLAENIKDHGAFSIRDEAPFEPNSNRVPGYPLFVATILTLFQSLYTVAVIQILIAGVSAILIYRLGMMLFRRKGIGVGAAMLFAIDPAGLYYSNLIMSETLFIFLLLVTIYLFFHDTDRPYKTATIIGFLIAIMILIRPISMTLPIVFLIAYPFRYNFEWKKTVLLILMMVIVMFSVFFPWMVRNKVLVGSWSLSSISSYNFYYSHALRWFMRKEKISEKEAKNIFYERLVTVHPTAPRVRVDVSVADAPYLQKLAFEYIGQDSFGYAFFHVSTLVPFFMTDGIREILRATNLTHVEFLNLRELFFDLEIKKFLGIVLSGNLLPTVFLGGFIVWGGITLLMLIGMLAGWWRSDTRLATFVLSAIIAIMAVSSGVVTTVRFRYAITPLIFLFAALGTYEIINRYTKLQRA